MPSGSFRDPAAAAAAAISGSFVPPAAAVGSLAGEARALAAVVLGPGEREAGERHGTPRRQAALPRGYHVVRTKCQKMGGPRGEGQGYSPMFSPSVTAPKLVSS